MLPAAWIQVLEKIEESLKGAVRETAARESVPPAVPDAAGRDANWEEALARLNGQVAALAKCVDRAEQVTAATDAALANAAEGLGRWLAAARKLAGGGGAV